MEKTNPKCSNCKFAGQNMKRATSNDACMFPMWDKKRKRVYRTMKYTTNSKDYTHCDKHEFVVSK